MLKRKGQHKNEKRNKTMNYFSRARLNLSIPSPATSLVAFATCFTRLAPMFFTLSLNSMLFATVTPSFVTLGAPKLCSKTTLRPCMQNTTNNQVDVQYTRKINSNLTANHGRQELVTTLATTFRHLAG